jgi:hypothetical protein
MVRARLVGFALLFSAAAAGASAARAADVLHEPARAWVRGGEGPVGIASGSGSAADQPSDLGSLATLDAKHAPEEPAVAGAAWQFSPNVVLHPAAEPAQHLWPDIAWSTTGIIGAAWMDDHAPGGYHIFYTQSTDDGVTWSTPEKVDDRAVGSYSKFVDLEFTPSGIPVAVWEDDRNGGSSMNVFMSKRTGGASPWTPSVRVNSAGSPPGPTYFMNPSLAMIDETRWFVAWTDWREGVFNQVYMRGTTNAGATWGSESRVSDELGYEPVAGDPCLIANTSAAAPLGAEILYCVTNDWRGDVPGGRYPNVYFYRSSDGGATWSVGVRVNDIEPLYQQVSSHALVQAADGAIVVGWLNAVSGPSQFRTCFSTNEGNKWSPSVQADEPIPGSSGTGTFSSIAASNAGVVVVYDLFDPSWDTYFRGSMDGGRTWVEPSVRMDDDPGTAPTNNPVAAVDALGRVAAAWSDGRAPSSNWKIFASIGENDVTSVDAAGDPASAWTQLVAIPNPSRAGAPIRFALIGASTGESSGAFAKSAREIALYDAAGRRVRTLALGEGAALWDGRDAGGAPVASGVYWARVGSPHPTIARLVLLR